MEAEQFLAAWSPKVDAALDCLLPTADETPTELHQAMRYSALAPGKRLRPALVIASALSVGEVSDSVIHAACAVELIHAFSLVHDDLPAIDNDALRRGRPTCHVKFGEGIALLAGDALFALAFETISGLDASSEIVVKALRVLSHSVGSNGLVGGEVADVLAEGKAVAEKDVEAIHRRKTGALIAASCTIGGLLAGATPAEVGALGNFGAHVGLAFQIADDLLNESATAEELGKASGSDRERSKATYPAVMGWQAARSRAETEVGEAISALRGLPARGALEALARYSIERGR